MTFFTSVDGTLLNAATVFVGGIVGTLVGDRLPKRLHEALFGALGLFTIVIGLIDAFTTKNPLILLGSLLVGVVVGEAANLAGRLTLLGDALQARFSREGSTVSEAFVTSSLVFCVGPLSILGALDNGLSGDTTKLAVKATLDGIAALAFSAALGWGVLFSVLAILLYQGTISLAAHTLAPALLAQPAAITELTATGGVILVAIGLRLLDLRDLRAVNYLPALVVAPALVILLAHAPHIGV